MRARTMHACVDLIGLLYVYYTITTAAAATIRPPRLLPLFRPSSSWSLTNTNTQRTHGRQGPVGVALALPLALAGQDGGGQRQRQGVPVPQQEPQPQRQRGAGGRGARRGRQGQGRGERLGERGREGRKGLLVGEGAGLCCAVLPCR